MVREDRDEAGLQRSFRRVPWKRGWGLGDVTALASRTRTVQPAAAGGTRWAAAGQRFDGPHRTHPWPKKPEAIRRTAHLLAHRHFARPPRPEG